MNIVPFNAGQGGIRAFVQNALRAGRFLGPGAMVEAINLARHHGPDAYAWVRREVIRGGRRIFRGMRRREHGLCIIKIVALISLALLKVLRRFVVGFEDSAVDREAVKQLVAVPWLDVAVIRCVPVADMSVRFERFAPS